MIRACCNIKFVIQRSDWGDVSSLEVYNIYFISDVTKTIVTKSLHENPIS